VKIKAIFIHTILIMQGCQKIIQIAALMILSLSFQIVPF
jgi:hypothetical protein